MSKFAASSPPKIVRRQHVIYGLYLPDQPRVILYMGSWRVAALDERLHQHQEGECKTTAKMADKYGVNACDLRMRVLRYWMSGFKPCPEGEITRALQAHGQGQWNHPYTFSTEDCQKGAHKQPREGKVRGGRISIARMSHEAKVRGGHNIPREAQVRGGCASGPINMAKMSHDDMARGGHNGNREGKAWGGRRAGERWGKSPEAKEQRIRAGRIGGLKAQAGWGKTLEAYEARGRGGRISIAKRSHEEHVRIARIANCSRWHSDRPKVDRLCAECTANRVHD